MLKIRAPRALIAAFAVTLGACASQGRMASEQPAVGEQRAFIVVQNNNIAEVDVFAVEGYSRWRLGTVRPGSSSLLLVPGTLKARPTIQLQAVELATGATYTSPTAPLSIGKRLDLKIASNLDMSSVVW